MLAVLQAGKNALTVELPDILIGGDEDAPGTLRECIPADGQGRPRSTTASYLRMARNYSDRRALPRCTMKRSKALRKREQNRSKPTSWWSARAWPDCGRPSSWRRRAGPGGGQGPRCEESSSEYAQGGIAVALSDDDEVELHEQDTIVAGAGLCDREAVHTLVEDGPAGHRGTDRVGRRVRPRRRRLVFAREGAHSRNRVLHAHGDSTGREISRTLYHKAASLGNVEFHSFSAITDLLIAGGEAVGAVACDRSIAPSRAHSRPGRAAGHRRTRARVQGDDESRCGHRRRRGAAPSGGGDDQRHRVRAVPPHGAASWKAHRGFCCPRRCAAKARTCEMPQGERFMGRYDARLELAPRDVVSRAIVAEMRRTAARTSSST